MDLSRMGAQTTALNHCEAGTVRFDAGGGRWRLELRDRLHGHEAADSARCIVNAGGVWTDELNARLGMESPYRHELSKEFISPFAARNRWSRS